MVKLAREFRALMDSQKKRLCEEAGLDPEKHELAYAIRHEGSRTEPGMEGPQRRGKRQERKDERDRWRLGKILDKLDLQGKLPTEDLLEGAWAVARGLLECKKDGWTADDGTQMAAGIRMTPAGKEHLAWFRAEVAKAREAGNV